MTRQRNQGKGGGKGGYHDGGGSVRSSMSEYGEDWEDTNPLAAAARGAGGTSPLEDLMKRKGIDAAWDALEDMHRNGTSTDRFTISRMLMKTTAEGNSRWQPSKVYRGISLVDDFIRLQPEQADEVLFNAVLDTCCRVKDLNRIDQFVRRMNDLGVPPSHVTLGILVKAYGQAGDFARVVRIWDEMADQRNQANAVTVGCMIDACVKCGQMDRAVDIFQEMKRKRKHRNTILYTTLIKGYGLEKDLPNALTLFQEMKAEGVPYNTITYNSIMDVCIKCQEMGSAEELLREMMAEGSQVSPDLITYSTLLKGYCHYGDLDRALQVAETIKARGLKCDELVYNTLIDGCVKANDLSAGIGLFAEMTASGMRPSSITLSILVRLYQRNGYKGEAFEAVAQLYQHHGLERPSASSERGGRGNKRGNNKGGSTSANAAAAAGGGSASSSKGHGRNANNRNASAQHNAALEAPVTGDASSRIPVGPVGRLPGASAYQEPLEGGPDLYMAAHLEALRGMHASAANGYGMQQDFPGQAAWGVDQTMMMYDQSMPYARRGEDSQPGFGIGSQDGMTNLSTPTWSPPPNGRSNGQHNGAPPRR
eukprot:TRINITY_DN66002_c0_g1_i1.p1 TRINITY_DN66002_c0_g1~~TRINITY_DN66002_c0_g1_i1.p1  ORF type:complete len:593 (-),score=115.20 TRINITY_DN66002_c0_g1_i1:322-2100(-)